VAECTSGAKPDIARRTPPQALPLIASSAKPVIASKQLDDALWENLRFEFDSLSQQLHRVEETLNEQRGLNDAPRQSSQASRDEDESQDTPVQGDDDVVLVETHDDYFMQNGNKRITLVLEEQIEHKHRQQNFAHAKDPRDVTKPVYRVEDFYHTDGCAQSLARTGWFFEVTMLVIVANAVYLGIEIDQNEAANIYDASLGFLVVEMFFCAFFSFEWLVRFLAFKNKSDGMKDFWFKFDSFLVATMVMEAWILDPILKIVSSSASIPTRPLRLLRLMRLTRMARLSRALPEMVTLGRGIFAASRAVASTVFVLFMIAYIFAITLRMVMDGQNSMNAKLYEETFMNFESLPKALWALGQSSFVLDGTGTLMTLLISDGSFASVTAGILLVVFMLLSNVTVLNMLVGVIIEVITMVGRGEKEEMDVELLKETILVELKKHDDGDGLLTRDELMAVMTDRRVQEILTFLNVNIWFIFQMQKIYFPKPDSKMQIKDVIDMMIKCRGDSSANIEVLLQAMTVLMKTFKANLPGARGFSRNSKNSLP